MTTDEWRQQLSAEGTRPGRPCSQSKVEQAEVELGQKLPAALRRLYLTADGLFDVSGQWWVIWPIGRLVRDTSGAWRSGRLDPDLVAFGDDGTGNPFCQRLSGADPVVLRWNWIDGAVEKGFGPVDKFLAEWAHIHAWPDD